MCDGGTEYELIAAGPLRVTVKFSTVWFTA
jgi:hypothetical protein